jgi:hypothetical protein
VRSSLAIKLAALAVFALAVFVLPRIWHWRSLPAVIVGALVAFTFFMVRWHARRTGYRCPTCDQLFAISPWTDFLSPHLSGVKMLRCPSCGRSSWCPEIDRAEVPDDVLIKPAAQLAPKTSAGSLPFQIAVVLMLYAALWIYSFYARSLLPVTVSVWKVVEIPLVTVILPALHAVFCLFAISRRYRSRIYVAVTAFVSIFILLAIWIQRAVILRLG